MCLFRVKNDAFSLPCNSVHVMDSEDRSLALGIVRWLPAYPKLVSHAVQNVKLYTRDREEYTGPVLWSFSRFWSSFIGIEVSNEEEYSILRILYCYSLQQLIFLAFCNDFDTRYRVLAYSLLRNTTLLFPNDVRSQLVPFSAIPRSWTWKCANLQTLNIRRKLIKIATMIIFSQWWSLEKGHLY